nr:recombinase RecT [uncultured Acetatifactor sp.]
MTGQQQRQAPAQQGQQGEVQRPKSSAVLVKEIISRDTCKKKFAEILGQKAPQFLASLTNVVSGSAQLKRADPNSIVSAAFVAATYDLPIDSNLGFAAIVPYNNNKYNPQTKKYEYHMEAQFQMMYKGFIQLAIRSGYYERMNYAVVYEDELVSYNPITGEIVFVTDFSECTQRDEGQSDKVAGYYAWFRLKTGYSQELYMSKKAVDNHAKKYSKAYRSDLDEGKKKSKWTTDFEAMALKTVIKLLLSKWGILSVDMQRAIQDDQKTFDEEGEATYGDNQPDAIEAENVFELPGPDNGQQKDEQPESAEGMAETGTDAADEGGYVDPDEVDAFMESMGLEELPFK